MPIKVLVVGNVATDVSYIKSRKRGYSILTVREGAEARKILNESGDISILVLDTGKYGAIAAEILEFINGNDKFGKLKTVVLTESDEQEKFIAKLCSGTVSFIRKPVSADALRAIIDLSVELLRDEQKLEQTAEKTITFDMIFNQAPIGIAIIHGADPMLSNEDDIKINSTYEQIIGRNEEELNRLGWKNVIHPDDLEEYMENFKKLQSGEIRSFSMDQRYIRPDGSIVWAHKTVAPIETENDRQFSYICLVQDITESKSFKDALTESERSKSVLLSHLPGLAYRCNYDPEWTMQYVSQGCYNLTGYPPESLLYNRDLSYNDLISPEYRQTLWEKWKQVLAERKQFKHEYEIITATGEKKWVLEMGQGIFNEKGEVEALEGIVLDISDRKAIEDALKFNLEHDRWTGLYNREYLVSLLERDSREKKYEKRALIAVNLSTAELLATKYGFQYTQNLIKKAAEALKRYCNGNRMLFNTSQNRFTFYITGYKDKNELEEFGHTIANTLESLLIMERISGGIGILEIDPENILEPELLLRRILVASERAISLIGKDFGVCFYDEELEAFINREMDITEALNNVVAADSGVKKDFLFLQFQPIVNLKTGEVCSFEALARLWTEKLGLVPALEFIPIAEKTKLIIPIGEKVIVNALRFLKRLNELGYHNVGITVNISVIQLLNQDFADRALELINSMELDPRLIGFEITESVFSFDYDIINNNIKKLRKAGVFIAIDDFGTGYSTFVREKELKVDFIKIDKYFIDDLLNCTDKAITSDIISMAHKLGHGTVAEGVEHEAQLRYLKQHNCDKIQGYLVSKPLDEEDAIRFLDSNFKNLLGN